MSTRLHFDISKWQHDQKTNVWHRNFAHLTSVGSWQRQTFQSVRFSVGRRVEWWRLKDVLNRLNKKVLLLRHVLFQFLTLMDMPVRREFGFHS